MRDQRQQCDITSWQVTDVTTSTLLCLNVATDQTTTRHTVIPRLSQSSHQLVVGCRGWDRIDRRRPIKLWCRRRDNFDGSRPHRLKRWFIRYNYYLRWAELTRNSKITRHRLQTWRCVFGQDATQVKHGLIQSRRMIQLMLALTRLCLRHADAAGSITLGETQQSKLVTV